MNSFDLQWFSDFQSLSVIWSLAVLFSRSQKRKIKLYYRYVDFWGSQPDPV